MKNNNLPMNDITHCPGQDCPLKDTCLRFTSKAYGRQDYFTRSPYDFKAGYCEYYWDEKPSEEMTRDLAYKIWEQKGYQEGKDFENWLEAQNILIDNSRNS